ncbi:unnamed protein product [Nezara viridula]|uniref:Uncharacterized protein n=1 Tax=Nezara viridula TaxID=85310 RepID=A0A9P0GWR2_NEZVI|nr:unnamed protein product [Nezara viridula]
MIAQLWGCHFWKTMLSHFPLQSSNDLGFILSEMPQLRLAPPTPPPSFLRRVDRSDADLESFITGLACVENSWVDARDLSHRYRDLVLILGCCMSPYRHSFWDFIVLRIIIGFILSSPVSFLSNHS